MRPKGTSMTIEELEQLIRKHFSAGMTVLVIVLSPNAGGAALPESTAVTIAPGPTTAPGTTAAPEVPGTGDGDRAAPTTEPGLTGSPGPPPVGSRPDQARVGRSEELTGSEAAEQQTGEKPEPESTGPAERDEPRTSERRGSEPAEDESRAPDDAEPAEGASGDR